MKVSKAVSLLKHPSLFTMHPLGQDKLDALNMGIDALERLQASRKRSRHSVHALLPNETFEEAV